MENDILDSLEDLGYSGPLLEDGALAASLEQGPQSASYTGVVSWMASELGGFVGLEETVSAVTCPEDAPNFLLELSGFLREYGCPYSTLTEGPINQRLVEKQHRLQLLDFLCTELSAVRLTATHKPQLLSNQEAEVMAESEVALHLKMACVCLGFPKPPSNITPFQLFSKIESKIKELMAKCPPSHLGKPLLNCRLSEKQWANIMRINEALCDEYKLRREMLLKRLDVTIQSFKWSDTAKQKEDAIAAVYQPLRKVLLAKPGVNVPLLLAAREDLLRIQKTSSGAVREKSRCAINRILMGRVPDRGGRPWESEPPPPEMPSFMKRDSQPQRQGSDRGGGRGGGRGRGRVQGGWSGGGDRGGSAGGNWQQGGQGHNQRGGGYNQQQGGGYEHQQNQGFQQGGYQQQSGYQQGGYGGNQGGYGQDSYRGGGGHRGGGRGRGGQRGRGRR